MEQYALQAFYAVMISVIAFFLKRLIGEHEHTRETINMLGGDIRIAQRDAQAMMTQITNLAEADQRINERLADIIERLVRMEERTAVANGSAVTTRKRRTN